VFPIAVRHVVGEQLRMQANLVRRSNLVRIEVVDYLRHRVVAVHIQQYPWQVVGKREVDTLAGLGAHDKRLNWNALLNLAKGVKILAAEVHNRSWIVKCSAVSFAV